MLSAENQFEPLLHNSLISALKNVLGDGGMNAVLFHTGLNKTNDIKVIHEKLSSLFGQGTPVLERAIVKELCAEMQTPYHENSNFDFTHELRDAYEKFAKSTKQ